MRAVCAFQEDFVTLQPKSKDRDHLLLQELCWHQSCIYQGRIALCHGFSKLATLRVNAAMSYQRSVPLSSRKTIGKGDESFLPENRVSSNAVSLH